MTRKNEPLADDLHLAGAGSRLPIQESDRAPVTPEEMRLKVMGNQDEQTERIEALRGLIERLTTPELTLAEAKDLRGRLSDLLERGSRAAVGERMTSSPVSVPSNDEGDGPRHHVWAPETSMRAAG
jgi:hypothetical protein